MAGYDNNKLGELRPNQIITTFGPGAIVDAVKDSVTVLDINYWKEKGKKIIDGRLASYLGVDCFYMPRTSYSGDVPVVSFACSQIILTSGGIRYQSGRTGTDNSSSLVSTRDSSRTYFPTKSLIAIVAFGEPVVFVSTMISNCPARVFVGR